MDTNRFATSTADSIPSPGEAQHTDWLARAQVELKRGDYRSAAYAAREATLQSESADAWLLRSLSSQALGRVDDAVYEARRAAELEPLAYEVHLRIADSLASGDRMAEAIVSYEDAIRSAPDLPEPRGSLIAALLELGRSPDALAQAEELHRRFPLDANASRLLALCVVEQAERVPVVRDADGYVVTSEDEIGRMRELLARATAASSDDEVRGAVRNVEEYLAKMERRVYEPPRWLLFLRRGRVQSLPASIFGFSVVALFGFLFLTLDTGKPLGTMLILGAGLGLALDLKVSWVPAWQAAARHGAGRGTR